MGFQPITQHNMFSIRKKSTDDKSSGFYLTNRTNCFLILVLLGVITFSFYRTVQKQLSLLDEAVKTGISSINSNLSGLKGQLNNARQKNQTLDLLTPYLLTRTKENLWMAVIHNDFISTQILRTGFWERDTTQFFTRYIKLEF